MLYNLTIIGVLNQRRNSFVSSFLLKLRNVSFYHHIHNLQDDFLHVGQYFGEGPRKHVEFDEKLVFLGLLFFELLYFDAVVLSKLGFTVILRTAPLFPQVPQ